MQAAPRRLQGHGGDSRRRSEASGPDLLGLGTSTSRRSMRSLDLPEQAVAREGKAHAPADGSPPARTAATPRTQARSPTPRHLTHPTIPHRQAAPRRTNLRLLVQARAAARANHTQQPLDRLRRREQGSRTEVRVCRTVPAADDVTTHTLAARQTTPRPMRRRRGPHRCRQLHQGAYTLAVAHDRSGALRVRDAQHRPRAPAPPYVATPVHH
jgi:hypothetical protein